MRHWIRTLLPLLSVICIACLVFATLRPGAASSDEEKTKSNLDKAITQLDLKDADGKSWSVSDLKGKKAVVVVFMGTECPINNAYMPRLAELHKEYSSKGVVFLGVNSNKQDTPAKIAAHVKEYSIPFPVLKDDGHRAADHFGAHRTPETFVLDSELKVRFDGRIDDKFGIGFQRAKATRDDLQLALEDILAGRKVAEPEPPVAGCLINRGSKAKTETSVTYCKEVSRIIQARCQECHRPGQIGPMALLTYEDVSDWSEMIREVVSQKRMPPWHADDKHHGQFSNERALTKDEYTTLLTWIDAGCPKGNEKDLPAARKFPDTWYIGKPDAVFEMPQDYVVPAKAPKGGVPYRYIKIDANFDDDKWIQAVECKPGNRAVVHHILAYINQKGKAFTNDGLGANMLGAYAPGDLGFVYPEGSAKKLPKGSSIIFQMHYTPNGVEGKDKSSIALLFATEPPKYEIRSRAISNFILNIPPNNANHEVRSETTFQKDVVLFSLLPHMHLRGKDFKYDIVYPGGKTETILFVPRYDFGWQSTYHLKQPLKLPAGTQIKCLAHFDNSTGNPWNPDPTATVHFGEQTWEEMMIGFIEYAYVESEQK
jgi:peroxiredoxin